MATIVPSPLSQYGRGQDPTTKSNPKAILDKWIKATIAKMHPINKWNFLSLEVRGRRAVCHP